MWLQICNVGRKIRAEKGDREEVNGFPFRDHLHLNMKLYVGFFVAAIPGQFTPVVSNLPTMQMSWRGVHKVGWGPDSDTKLLVDPSFCSVTVR